MSWDAGSPPGPVQGTALIGKALRLVDAIGAAPGAIGVRDLLAETGWSRPTLYRILSALVAEGYVRRDPALRGYTLGYRFLELAQNAWAGSDLVAMASLELQRLRNVAGETVYLAIPGRDGVLSLGRFESPHAVRSAARLGILKPYHCTSQGKAMLAFWDREEVDRRIGPGPYIRHTEATIVSRDDLDPHLAEIRARGFAIENEEILAGTRCVGAPILDRTGKPLGAISVAGPAWRLTSERAEQLGPEVAEVASHISRTLRAFEPARQTIARAPVVAACAPPALYGADPWWDPTRSRLLWTDRLGQALHETGPDGDRHWPVPPSASIACAGHDASRSLMVTGGEVWVARRGAPGRVHAPALAAATAAASDARGIWIAVPAAGRTGIGALLGEDGTDARWTVTGAIGALCRGPDGTVFAADAERGVIYAAAQEQRSLRVFSRIPPASGQPRALACDPDGRLWVALYDGWAVARLDEAGELAETIPVPVPRPAGLAFGGPDGRTLFVTTARYGLARDLLERAPLSGALLEFTVAG